MSSNGHFAIDLPLKKESLFKRIKRIVYDPEFGLFGLCLGSGSVALVKFSYEVLNNQTSSPIYLVGGFGMIIFAMIILNDKRMEP